MFVYHYPVAARVFAKDYAFSLLKYFVLSILMDFGSHVVNEESNLIRDHLNSSIK